MSSPYRLPPGVDELDDGILGPEGALAWAEDEVYAWTPSNAWTSLSDPSSAVEDGFHTPEGVLLGTEDDGLGFWAFGDEAWTWWRDASEHSVSAAHPPIGDQLVAEDQQGFNDRRLLVYDVSPAGLEHRATVEDVPDLPEPLEFAFVYTPPDDADASSAPSPHLVLLSGETLRRRPLSGDAESFRTTHLSLEKEVRWLTDQFPPTVGGMLSEYPPQMHGNALFLHRDSTSPRTTLAVDLGDGTVAATGLVPLGRSSAPWRAQADHRPDEIAPLINTLRTCPPPSDDRHADTVELLDVAMGEQTVHAVLTDHGICTGDTLPSPSAPDTSTSVESEDNIWIWWTDSLLSWRLWVGEDRAEQTLYRKLASEITDEALYVEPLQVQIGIEACRRFFDELRGEDPPRSMLGDFDYSDDAIRALFGPHGSEVAPLVASGLADEHTPVRAAACMAAGATDDDPILAILDREPIPESRLWPDRAALPREALWDNLSHEAPEVRTAAAKTCGLLRLAGSADSLQPLLHDTPLLDTDVEDVRETALEALRLVPEVPDSGVQDIEACVRADPSASVRQTAVETLGPHCRGASSLEALIWSLGDTARGVGDDVSDALLEHATDVTPEQYRELIDRWLLRYLGHRWEDDVLAFGTSFPEQLPGQVLGQRVIAGDIQDFRSPIHSPEDLTVEDLTTDKTVQLAPAAISILAILEAVVEEVPLSSSFGESSSDRERMSEFEQAFQEHLVAETFLDEIDMSNWNYPAPSMQAAECAVAVYEHDARLGRRLAAVVLSELGLPSEEQPDRNAGGYRPMHARLRDHSGVSPHGQCHHYVQELAEAGGVGGLLGLYVLAAWGDDEAEASLVDRFTTGALTDVPLARSLLQSTTPFSTRSEAFFEGTLLGPYISADNVSLARRWEAFQDQHHMFKTFPVETDHVSPEQWNFFFRQCAAADELLSWDDRHGAALHLAWLDDQYRRPAELWDERASSIGAVPDDEQPGYVRDQIWAGRSDDWAAFWDHWPDGYGYWAFHMLADRGDAEAAARIETALEDETVPQQPATEALQAIRARNDS